jgi:hypothetical protein
MTEHRPSYDPEEYTTLNDRTSSSFTHRPSPSNIPYDNSIYRPYPNLSSYLLGEWFWNEGAQKSLENFKKLVEILSAPAFIPGDICNTDWKKVNDKLTRNQQNPREDDDSDNEFQDEVAGWTRTPVVIPVPFQYNTVDPGVRQYVAAELHHRSMVSVIQERLTRKSDCHLFNYEPYELLWKAGTRPEQHVYGELYASQAFREAHQKVLDSPAEEGCNLPRAIAALMLWSDATHLTSFGNAQLWPLYLFFGNESKYRRCKPSYHTCEHIAYFEKV